MLAWKAKVDKRPHPIQPDTMLFDQDFERELQDWIAKDEVKM